jgi:hypothetical protein
VRPVACGGAAGFDGMSDDRQRDSGEGFLSRWSRRKAVVREGGKVQAEPLAPPDDVEPERAAGSGAVPVDGAAASSALEGAETSSAGVSVPEGVHDAVDHERAVGLGEAPLGSQPMRAARRSPKERPGLTIQDVVKLTRDSDYSPFVAPDVDPAVSNAAMKKLFSDPQFNVMDGLDVYIDDYTKFEPVSKAMMRTMVVARALGLLDDELTEQPKPAGFELGGERPDVQALVPQVPADAATAVPNALVSPVDPTLEPPIDGTIDGTTDPASVSDIVGPILSIENAVDNHPSNEDAHLQLQSHDAAGRAGLDEGADTDDGSRGDGKRPRV